MFFENFFLKKLDISMVQYYAIKKLKGGLL